MRRKIACIVMILFFCAWLIVKHEPTPAPQRRAPTAKDIAAATSRKGNIETGKGLGIPILIGSHMDEVTYTEAIAMPSGGIYRYTYPTAHDGKAFLRSPRCVRIVDEQARTGPFVSGESKQGFTIKAAPGHVISMTFRAIIAKGPLA